MRASLGLMALVALLASAQACTIYSLPAANVGGTVGAIVATPAGATAFCAAKGGPAGQTRTSTLGALGAAAAWDLPAGVQATAPTTQVFSGIECIVSAACTADGLGNYGIGNLGTGNFGNNNQGSDNVGNNNNGLGNIGDGNNALFGIGNGLSGANARGDIAAVLAANAVTVAAPGAPASTGAPEAVVDVAPAPGPLPGRRRARRAGVPLPAP